MVQKLWCSCFLFLFVKLVIVGYFVTNKPVLTYFYTYLCDVPSPIVGPFWVMVRPLSSRSLAVVLSRPVSCLGWVASHSFR
jgi:hypothetical protein